MQVPLQLTHAQRLKPLLLEAIQLLQAVLSCRLMLLVMCRPVLRVVATVVR